MILKKQNKKAAVFSFYIFYMHVSLDVLVCVPTSWGHRWAPPQDHCHSNSSDHTDWSLENLLSPAHTHTHTHTHTLFAYLTINGQTRTDKIANVALESCFIHFIQGLDRQNFENYNYKCNGSHFGWKRLQLNAWM